MAPPVLKLDDIRLSFGGTPLLDGAALQVEPGDRICLVGRNGSGKSTLLKIAAGLAEAQSGEIFRHPSATVRYLPQEPDFDGYKSVGAYVEAGLAPGDDPYRAAYLMEHLGIAAEADPARLSGGEARRAALARTLAPSPDILLLDEPTNHLDLPAIEWLEDELQRQRGAVLIISHDRRFLERLSRITVWLDRGRTLRLDRGFAHFEEWRDDVLEAEEREHHKLGRAIEREEHWLRYGVTARRKRNMRRLGELKDMRVAYRNRRGPLGRIETGETGAQDSGKLVIEAEAIAKSFSETPVVRDFSIRINRGDRIGLIGPNGAGKTTLLKMLTGMLAPDAGTVKLGTNLAIGLLDQRRDQPKADETLAHFLTDGRGETLLVHGEQRHVTGYMKDFLFAPEQARTPVRNLSGGEKARLILARMLARPSNLLVLDEPTNDLDMETLDLLQELVAGYPGTVLLVSHDRDFLDRTVTSILAPAQSASPDGRWVSYAGGYSDMVAQRAGEAQNKKARQETPPASPAAARSAPPESPAPGGASAAARKLSYKQKFALETLPGEIAGLEAKASELETAMADPGLFTRNPDAFSKKAAELEAVRAKLEALETEWLELEMLREEIGG